MLLFMDTISMGLLISFEFLDFERVLVFLFSVSFCSKSIGCRESGTAYFEAYAANSQKVLYSPFGHSIRYSVTFFVFALNGYRTLVPHALPKLARFATTPSRFTSSINSNRSADFVVNDV